MDPVVLYSPGVVCMETDHGLDQKMGASVVGGAVHLSYANVS
jgi:hypothetical protein